MSMYIEILKQSLEIRTMPIYESGTKYLSEELLNFYTTQHMMVNSLDFNYTYQAYLIWVSLLISDHGPSLYLCNSCVVVLTLFPRKINVM